MPTYDYIAAAKSNPDNIVTLDYGAGTLELLTADEFQLSTGNDFTTPLDGKLMDAAGGYSTMLRGIQQIGKFKFEVKNFRESILYYNGSKSLDLQYNGILVASKETDDLNRLVEPLLELTNPDFDISAFFDLTMVAPLGYAPNATDPNGKVAVKIGRWFRSTRVYVLMDANITVSKAKLPNGKPLYLGVQISLKPSRMLSINEVKGFLL